MRKFDNLRRRLARLQIPKTDPVQYIAVWGDEAMDREYREALGIHPVDYSGPYLAEWEEREEEPI